MSIKPLDINAIESRADNLFESIVVMSKRARQINEELKIEFNQRMEMLQTRIYDPEAEESEQPQTNPDQILIAQEFERRPKPADVAIREMMEEKLEFRYKGEEPEVPTT